MKKLLFTASLALSVFFTQAQYYSLSFISAGQNPGGINTEDEQPYGSLSTTYTGYTEVFTPGSTAWSPVQTLPFSFEFDGGVVTDYYIAPSGVLTFSSNLGTVPSSSNAALPTAMIPDSSICAWGMNLSGGNDGVVTKTFGTAPNRQQWIIWASASAAGISGGWTYWGIVLEETTNNIHVVDMRTYNGTTALTVGVQIDQSTAFSIGSSVNSTNSATGGGVFDASDNTYYTFINGVQPQFDVQNASIDNNVFHEVNTANSIEGTVSNLGSATITSLTVEYTIDGGSAVSANITGLNIASGTSASYTHPTPWTPSVTATYDVQTLVTAVNGNVDANPSDNSASMDVIVHPTPVARTPLLEAFTSSTCAPCTPGNINVGNVLAAFPGEYSKVNYQMSWPGSGDPYFTNEGGDRRTYYGVNSVPNIFTDGLDGINSNSYAANIFTSAQNVPAFISMEAEATVNKDVVYEITNGQLEVVSSKWVLNSSSWFTPVIDLPGNLVAHHAINEKLTFLNVETNGETEFEHVMKKMMPDASGESLNAVTANDTVMLSNSHDFVGEYRLSNDAGDPIIHSSEHSIEEFSDLEIVFWIQSPATGDIWQSYREDVELTEETSNLTVLVENGDSVYVIGTDSFEMTTTGTLVPLSVDERFNKSFKVYPNPAKDVVYISGVEGVANVTVYDVQGRTVKQVSTDANTLRVSDLNAGMYMIRIENNGVVSSTRISVTK
ncbi:T9SS type A sorting domain-containing protein [Salibacteraceae bacterium]|nr:T9SS type A sorting domain-containing protein [Salibacteraceae bacterium]